MNRIRLAVSRGYELSIIQEDGATRVECALVGKDGNILPFSASNGEREEDVHPNLGLVQLIAIMARVNNKVNWIKLEETIDNEFNSRYSN